MKQPPFGTAQRDVLLKLADLPGATWNRRDGGALYENRALTDNLCQALVLQGYLDEELDGILSVYTVNRVGMAKAHELRGFSELRSWGHL